MQGFYVYYRIASPQQAAVQAAVLQLFTLLQAQTGIQGRLLRRVDDVTTWMEVYEGIADAEAFSSALQQNTRSSGLQALLGSTQRVIERFEDV